METPLILSAHFRNILMFLHTLATCRRYLLNVAAIY